MANHNVFITGMGLIGPSGSGGGEFIKNLDQIDSHFEGWPSACSPPHGEAKVGLSRRYDTKDFYTERQLRLLDRAMAMSACATGIALKDAGLGEQLNTVDKDDVATLFATTRCEQPSSHRFSETLLKGKPQALNPALFPQMTRNIVCGQIAITFGFRGVSSMLASGPLSSLEALARGYHWVKEGKAKIAVIGSVESLGVFSINQCLLLYADHLVGARPQFFGSECGQVIPSDGASVVVLESQQHAESRGASVYAELRGVTFGRLGRTGEEGMEAAQRLEEFISESDQIEYAHSNIGVVSCSQAGSNLPHCRTELDMFRHLAQSKAWRPSLTAIKSHLGEAEAMASMAQVQVAAQCLKSGSIPATQHVSDRSGSTLNIATQPQRLNGSAALVTAFDASKRFAFARLSSRST